MRSRLGAVLLLAFGVVGCAPSPGVAIPDPNRYETCTRVVIRPDRLFSDPKSCTPVRSPARIANEADVVMLGSFWDVSERRTRAPLTPPRNVAAQ